MCQPVSEYKDYVQSVSQQVDILQHHMPGLCALSRQTNANTVIHTLMRSDTHDLWFLKSLSQYKEGRDVASHTSMCPCARTHTHTRKHTQTHTHTHTHTCTRTYNYTLTFSVKKSKIFNSSHIIYCR